MRTPLCLTDIIVVFVSSLTYKSQNDGDLLSSSRDIPSLSVELQGRDVLPRESDKKLARYGTARRWPVSKHS